MSVGITEPSSLTKSSSLIPHVSGEETQAPRRAVARSRLEDGGRTRPPSPPPKYHVPDPILKQLGGNAQTPGG